MNQQKKIKILLLVFILTLALSVFLLIQRNIQYASDNNDVAQLDSIGLNKITFTYNGKTHFLKLERNKWIINDKFKTKDNLINLTKLAFQNAEIKRPVAKENIDKVKKYIIANGIKLSIDKENPTSCIIAPNSNDINSTYFLADEQDVPSIIYVPGFSGDICNLFMLDEINWRTKELFKSSSISFQSLNITYPSMPENNVTIEFSKPGEFNVKNVTNIDTAKVYDYLSQYNLVQVQNYVTKDTSALKQFFNKNKPQVVITLVDIQNTRTLKLYQESKDPVGIYGYVEETGDIIIMNIEVLSKLLVRKDYFVKKNK